MFKGSREEAFAQQQLLFEPPHMVLFPTVANCSRLLCRESLLSECSLRLMQTFIGLGRKRSIPTCVASASLGVHEHSIPLSFPLSSFSLLSTLM